MLFIFRTTDSRGIEYHGEEEYANVDVCHVELFYCSILKNTKYVLLQIVSLQFCKTSSYCPRRLLFQKSVYQCRLTVSSLGHLLNFSWSCTRHINDYSSKDHHILTNPIRVIQIWYFLPIAKHLKVTSVDYRSFEFRRPSTLSDFEYIIRRNL